MEAAGGRVGAPRVPGRQASPAASSSGRPASELPSPGIGVGTLAQPRVGGGTSWRRAANRRTNNQLNLDDGPLSMFHRDNARQDTVAAKAAFQPGSSKRVTVSISIAVPFMAHGASADGPSYTYTRMFSAPVLADWRRRDHVAGPGPAQSLAGRGAF
ncbi:hypothetical protein ACCO45_003835 [Purpureocillium lilacinum]|uniref:Uncharacterized protein n=1 Tax=Purpureocillium lilacinum TaxID=33203 RepID=A0ACC4E298_PURLI